jgi:2'-5' RNA ligase
VARYRGRDHDATADVAALAGVRSDAWTVREVVLMRSHLGPRPSYEPLASSTLAG